MELHFREIKTLLRLNVLRCLKAQMVHKELLLHVIAYDLIRSLMQQAAICHHVDLRRISFKGTLDTLHHFADAIRAAGVSLQIQRAGDTEMLRVIALTINYNYDLVALNLALRNTNQETIIC